MKKLFIGTCLLSLLGGCSVFRGGFDGVSGSSSFACKAPDGVLCDSMTGVVANMEANNLPSQQVKHKQIDQKLPSQKEARTRATTETAMPVPQYTGAPLIQQPKTLRVWIAPWESADRTLFDQQYFYIVINNWDWKIEHNKRRISDAYAPVGGTVSPYANVQTKVADPQININDQTPVAIEPFANDAPIPVNKNNVQNNSANNPQVMNGINTEIADLNVDISKFTRQ